jgi:hypothetical protein
MNFLLMARDSYNPNNAFRPLKRTNYEFPNEAYAILKKCAPEIDFESYFERQLRDVQSVSIIFNSSKPRYIHFRYVGEGRGFSVEQFDLENDGLADRLNESVKKN